MEIGRRIYYEKATGNVILDTGERFGDVIETTVEQEFEMYKPLSERTPESVGNIDLEFGQYREEFSNSSGYRINTETLKIEFSSIDPDEPDAEPTFEEPLTDQLASVKKENLSLQSRVSDVEMMLTEILFS